MSLAIVHLRVLDEFKAIQHPNPLPLRVDHFYCIYLNLASRKDTRTLRIMDGVEGLYKPLSLTDRRASIVTYDESGSSSPTRTLTLDTNNARLPARMEKIVQTRPRGPPTPNMMTPSAELDSPTHSNHDPPPPPTPAASPGPDCVRPDWSDAGDQEDIFLAQIRHYFKQRSHAERTRILGDLLNLCTVQQLSFVSQYVNPLLKKDPFTSLPDELCLRVCDILGASLEWYR